MRINLVLLRSASEIRAATKTTKRRTTLRWWVFGASSAVLGGASAYHYWKADATQRRRFRVEAEGVVRFLR